MIYPTLRGFCAMPASLGLFITAGLLMSVQDLGTDRAGAPAPEPFVGLSEEQQEILGHQSIVQIPDGMGGTRKTLQISGINVRIVNGLGATNGNPLFPNAFNSAFSITNGLGNLIVGYNELGNPNGDARTGSHNIIVGQGNSYTQFGGLVDALDNTISSPFASVSGGAQNVASGFAAAVTGGAANSASGQYSTTGGGGRNDSAGFGTTISGGFLGNASGYGASITGGARCIASGVYATVSGGDANLATGPYAWVGGGQGNDAAGRRASVSGGRDNAALAQTSSIGGGYNNATNGVYSSVSGGQNRSVAGTSDWRAGSLFEDY